MKKRISLIIICLIPLIALAVMDEVRVINFYGNYVEPIGNARAKEFLGISNFLQGVDIDIEKTGPKSIKVTYGSEVKEFSNLPGDIFEMKEASWEDFNLSLTRQSLSMSLSKFDGKTENSISSLEGLNLNCLISNRNRRGSEYNMLIHNCTKHGSARLSEFKDTNKRKDNFLSVFFYRNMHYPLASETVVSDLKLDINNHNYSLTTKVKSGMSAKVKISGKVWFLENENELKVRIDKAKAGIISIKNKIFTELEASKDPKIRVQRPDVFIDLN